MPLLVPYIAFKETITNYILLERLWTVEFGKNIRCFGRAFVGKTEARKQETTKCYLAELIRYQTQAEMFKYCTALLRKDQS